MYIFPEELRRAYESSPLSYVYYQNIDGRAIPVLASDGFCQNTGMSRDRVLTWLEAGLFERMHPDDVGFMSKVSEDFLNNRGLYDVVFRCRIGKGYISIHGFGKWQTMPDGTELAVIGYANISETKEVQLTVAENYQLFRKDQFYIDAITGLPNLNYLKQFADERINALWAAGTTPAVIYFDIRSMATYNMEYGYAKGDELVQLTGRTLSEQFPDALVTRGEGDHFIMVAEYDEELGKKALKANKRIKRTAYGRTTGIQCAIVKMLPEMKAIEGIDRARSTLKEIGDDLNIVYRFYTHGEDDDYWMGRYILQNFDDALENGWIRVFYQPILRTRTEKVTILEGLARWVDPRQGLISPGRFIPVLSQYHLLHKLDIYMVEQICREFHVRREAGLPLVPVTVNISAQDFDYVDVVEILNATLEKYGLERNKLIVEITEQDLAQATDHFRNQLERIHESGYKLWVDDFGSGYSSLNVFNRYHVDRVKFDMDFVRHLDDNNGANRTILKYMVEMCRQLEVHTLAEGVETKKQYEFLSDVDCEMVQGFYMYKPEPVEMSIFKIQNTGSMVPIEEAGERKEMCARWIRKGQA
jgi:EAL domain-containing protein (putative c-di-GMP-specific phosphodiesterase class I)